MRTVLHAQSHAVLRLLACKLERCFAQDFIAEKAQGSYVWTTDGQKHLDMACGKPIYIFASKVPFCCKII